MHAQKLALFNNGLILTIHIWFENDIAETSLIMQCHEHDALGCAWHLPHRNLTSRSYVISCMLVSGLREGRQLHLLQFLSSIRQCVRPDGEAGNMMVCNEPFNVAHAQQNRRGIVVGNVLEERTSRSAVLRDLP